MSAEIWNNFKIKFSIFYDLEERTAIFEEQVIDFIKTIVINDLNRGIIDQLMRSTTSIGANYVEADCAESKKDFKHQISICKKESEETTYWFRMLARMNPEKIERCRKFWQEAHEFTLIFSLIINKTF